MSLTLSCLAEDCWQGVSPETRFNITMSLLCHQHFVSWQVVIITLLRIRDWCWHARWVQEMYNSSYNADGYYIMTHLCA